MAAPLTGSARAARRSARAQRRRNLAIAGACVLGAVGAALATGSPTSHAAADLPLRVALAVAVTLAATRAEPSSFVFALAMAVVISTQDTTTFLVALGFFGLTVGVAVLDVSGPVIGAAIGAGAVQLLLRLPSSSPTNLSAFAAALAMGAIVFSGVRRSPARTRRVVYLTAAGIGIGALFATVLFATIALWARSQIQDGVDAARAGIDAARRGDTPTALHDFDMARRKLAGARTRLDLPFAWPARAVPIVAQHERALRTLVKNAESLVAVGLRAERDADIESLHVDQGRLDPARVTKMRGPLLRVEAALQASAVDLERIHSPWLIPPVHDTVDALTRDVQHARGSATTAALGVDAAPRLLGADRPRTYFIAFTTPAEARAAGGFMGNWGILTVSDGQFELSAFGRTDDLNAAGDAATKHISGPSDYVARYGRFSPAAEWRNVNVSPDFPTVAEVVRELYPQSGGGPIDGVIALDPEGLAALLQLTGPVVVPGRATPLTSENAAQFLLRDQYLEFANPDRIDFLADAARTVTDRLTHSNLPGPRTVGKVLARAARGGHLQVHSFDPQGEQLFRRLGAEQILGDTPGDFLGLVTQNASGNKIELFLHRTLRVDSKINPTTGKIESTVEIRLRNDAPTQGLPDYVIGNVVGLPRGTNRLYLSLYTSLVTTRVTLDGAPVTLESQVERGLNVYSQFITVAPGAEVVLRLELAGSARFVRNSKGPSYRLDILHQTMVNADDVSVRVRLSPPWSFGGSEHGFAVQNGNASYHTTLEQRKTLAVGIDH